MDALSQLLTLNDPQGSIDKNCLLDGDWTLPHSAGELSVIRWHTVTQGQAKLEMPSGDALTLMPGRAMILPHNSAHRLRRSGEESTHIVCGSLRLQTTSRYFLTALPELLHFAPPPHSPAALWLDAAILLLRQESELGLPGAEVLCSQQCATLFTLAVRYWLSQSGTSKSMLNLLVHPRLGQVMFNMLETPGYPWTVETLAQRVHMSRASFAQLFRDVSGSTPLTVLTTLRLQIAAQSLSRQTLPVIAIAESVGYASESSFHKAFVREFSCTPGEYRKRANLLGR
ncbi:cupin domain-containing protein [Salmonella enterica]|nr:AraC family transcriptional regulator [Salmonella enterica]EEP8163891.1 AraC family transcriptional regulator [Salmonella enterica subsp. enterica serovar Poona]EHB3563438.1 AraC family transcriptional regulator [Salmonella enterica subsp. enterica serovar Oranienburg]HAE7710966.1 AraC family transcriptional regulator [Salmonella enterica subsp. enterica]EBE9925442.1 AraC family transcriptional regulator [Salmonella enterica]